MKSENKHILSLISNAIYIYTSNDDVRLIDVYNITSFLINGDTDGCMENCQINVIKNYNST